MAAGQEEIIQFEKEDLEILRNELSDEDFLKVTYLSFPSVWMEANLMDPNDPTKPFVLRDYQKQITDARTRNRILRLGRQTGKTTILVAKALWKAINVPGSKIIITTPRESQIKAIFSKLKTYMATASPAVRRQKKRITATHPMLAEFKNGSTITGYTAAKESAAAGGASIRGSSASDLYIDEADYIDDDTMTDAVMPVITSFTYPSIWMSSTPTGRVGYFYKEWYSGNYATFHYSSRVSPSWNAEKEARIQRLDKATRQHEYEAEFGDSDAGVFRTSDIEALQEKSSKLIQDGNELIAYSYDDIDILIGRAKHKIIGVDWNKTHGTRIVIITIDSSNKICLIHKERIASSEFTQHEAVARIRQLDSMYSPDFIAVDVGHGEMQIEELRLLTIRDPGNPIGNKIVPVHTDGTLEILDPLTFETRNTYVKNFVVKSTVRTIEQGILTLPIEEHMQNDKKMVDSQDLTLADQMRNYYIDKITSSGREVYACRSDHDLDALMFAIFAYVTQILKINNLYDLLPTTSAASVPYKVILQQREMDDRTRQAMDDLPKDISDMRTVPVGYSRNKNRIGRSITSRSMGLSSRFRGRSLYG